jgi:hypothetical protein
MNRAVISWVACGLFVALLSTLALPLGAAAPVLRATAPVSDSKGIVLINPGFEAPVERRPRGWILGQHAGTRAYKMEHDVLIRHEGKQSFRVSRFAEQVFGSVFQFVPLPKGHKFKKIELSAMLRSEATDGDGWGLVANVNGVQTILEQYNSEALVGTHDWRRVTLSIPITSDATDIKVGATLLGGGTGWIDDVTIKVIE